MTRDKRAVAVSTIFGMLLLSLGGVAQAAEDAAGKTVTISGHVGLPGVTLQGLPGTPVTDKNGNYSVDVTSGWPGTVIPVKVGYTFMPPSRQYIRVTENLNEENYSASVLTFEISGTVGWPGVAMRGLPGNVLTDADGRYVAMVEYGWSGTVTPTREGCTFEPSSHRYDQVKANQSNQNYAVASVQGPASQGIGVAADILVIPTRQVDAPAFAETKEDMQIMLQILREKISEPRTILGVLYDFGDFFGSGGRQPEALYLQGYGALFVLEVSFPLSPGATSRSVDANEPKQRIDPVWQRAQRQLYAPPGGRVTPTQADPASFEQFKGDMAKTLKHAANIRHLGPEESVILTIVGQAHDPAGGFGSTSGGPYSGGFVTGGGFSAYSSGSTIHYSDSSSYARVGGSVSRRRMPAAATGTPTVLTIQATKADIDAFAQGNLDFEQFNARTKTFSY